MSTTYTLTFLLTKQFAAVWMEVGEDYKVLELIGEGSFGRVYKGRRKFTKQVIYAPLWKEASLSRVT